MANKTRANILSQVYEYIPQANVTSHNTLTDNLCDLAVEEISHRYNFRYLRATTPATHSIAQGEYNVAESDFTFTSFKEVIDLEWIKSATGEHGFIDWLPEKEFKRRFKYIEYSGNSQGKPNKYTSFGNTFHFNCQLDEAVDCRAWYQQLHGNFTDDNTSHSFEPDNLGFQAIVACVLAELRESLPGLKWSDAALKAIQKKDYWINKMIEFDLTRLNEEVEIEPRERKDLGQIDRNPYDWV